MKNCHNDINYFWAKDYFFLDSLFLIFIVKVDVVFSFVLFSLVGKSIYLIILREVC